MSVPVQITNEGTALIADREIAVPSYRLERVVGGGASGLVFCARHRYLGRQVALKIWLQRRMKDRRDKFMQGIEEARKAADAELIAGSHAVRVIEAGEVRRMFFAVTEYVDGITLEEWLASHQWTLGLRYKVAMQVWGSAEALSKVGIIHGDLHTKNILMPKNFDEERETGMHRSSISIPIKIVDFGTSLFTSREYSAARHWKIFEQTISRILAPISVTKLYMAPRPDTNLPEATCEWYYEFLMQIPSLLECSGAYWFRKGTTRDIDMGEWERIVRSGELRMDKLGYEVWPQERLFPWPQV
jgi:serine/threonine protein kinase